MSVDFSSPAIDKFQWTRNGLVNGIDYPKTRNDEFLLGIRGALTGTLDTFNIGKLAVQLIGKAHEQI